MKQPGEEKLTRPSATGMAGLLCGSIGYAVLLTGFALAARYFKLDRALGARFPAILLSFALLLVPYWAFGFGFAEKLGTQLRNRFARLLLPALLVLPYLLSTVPFGECRLRYVLAFALLPVAIAALLTYTYPGAEDPSASLRAGSARVGHAGLSWNDIVVLLVVGLPVEFGWLRGAWPQAGLGAFPKLLLMDAALYGFLVIRPVAGTGYDFRPRWRDLAIGLREWIFFAPLAVALGIALRFIHPHGLRIAPYAIAPAWLVTFFFVAIPEELFFRGLLQNRLEQRLRAAGKARAGLWASAVASVIFGLSHFNKPGPFNWRYVLLASIAGVFYGRAWRDRRRLLCSGITHATIDVVWSVCFR